MASSDEDKLRAEFGYNGGILDRAYKFPEDFAVLEESCGHYTIMDFTPGDRKRIWANKAYLHHYGQTLDEYRAHDFNTLNSEAVHRFQNGVHETTQVNGKTARYIKTIYPNGVPATLFFIMRPIRVIHPFTAKGCDFTLGEPTRRSHELMNISDVMSLTIAAETGHVDYANPRAKEYYYSSSPLKMENGEQKALNLTDIFETCIWENDCERAESWSCLKGLNLQSHPLEFECRKIGRMNDEIDRWHRMVFVPCINPATGSVSLFLNEYDISQLKQTEGDLTAANDAQDSFVASVTHDLRTPLNGMIGLSDALIQDPRCPDYIKKNLRVIKTTGNRLSMLVNDILDAASARRNTLTVKHEQCDVAEIVQNVLDIVSP
eukprot:CAMPEP_0181331306 /NCGR_PEP_ID=MMETSP1101-20121128/24425_1 /TAXON_ID=46948 /ORGANISM="Rhodomonas abbreviata, Strain Caron Lab Isolate" /LENGTH=375 /DNA_ID=CAMNT_0023440745 /DNA_START=1 /DNA_END=1125 /DNA_ORIENTATION=+